MENHASNPAGRLWLYFDYLNSQSRKQPVIRLAAKYFNSGTPLSARHMAGVAALMALPDEVETMVNGMERYPIPEAKLLRPLPKVREYFRADPLGNKDVAWAQSFVDSGVLSDLETTSHILDGFVVRAIDVSDDDRQSVKTLAQEILALVLADETLDDETRAVIVRYAHRIVEAIDLYKVKGPQPLLDELDRFYSASHRVPAPSNPTLRRKLSELGGAIILMIELLAAPATVANAIEYYDTTFAMRQITEAPGEDIEEIILMEVPESWAADDQDEGGAEAGESSTTSV